VKYLLALLLATLHHEPRIPAAKNQLTHYLVQCALPADKTFSYIDDDGVRHSERGRLGFAPKWSYGSKLSTTDEELLSACLAAFTNSLGVHVAISISGSGYLMDLSRFPYREGCFFGNIFKDHVYSGDDRDGLAESNDADLRVCSLPGKRCPPIVYVGKCKDICTPDPSGLFYTKCYVGEKAYPALSTRLHGK
jgi:hypothetical protein